MYFSLDFRAPHTAVGETLKAFEDTSSDKSYRIVRFGDRIVVTHHDNPSWLTRKIDAFYNWQNESALKDLFQNVLHKVRSGSAIHSTAIRHLSTHSLPFLSRQEQDQIKTSLIDRQTATSVNKLPTEVPAAEEPTPTSADSTEAPSESAFKTRIVFGEKDKLLRITQKLRLKLPYVRLSDCRQFLTLYNEQGLLYGKHSDDAAVVFGMLERHFKEVHQEEEFQGINLDICWKFIKQSCSSETKHIFAEQMTLLDANQSPARIQIIEQLLRHIKQHVLNPEAPIYGHPREVLQPEHISLLKVLDKSDQAHKELGDLLNINGHSALEEAENAIAQAIEQTVSTSEFRSICKELTYQAYDEMMTKATDNKKMTNEELILFNKAHKAFLTTRLQTMHHVSFHLLKSSDKWPSDQHQIAFKNMYSLGSASTIKTDTHVLHHLKQAHDSYQNHPKVVIQGGGVSGLLSALMQYEAGANVTLFEKSSSNHDRTHVVRLDPLWMDLLQFYLGTKTDTLCREYGVINSDNFCEIPTFRLEEALRDRLTELISVVDDNHTLNHLPSYEVDIADLDDAPDDGQFYVTASYSPDSSLTSAATEATPKTLHKPFDLYIVAGGKDSVSSPASAVKEILSPKPVTADQQYAVAVWEGTLSASAVENSAHDSVDNFRNILVMEQKFINHFVEELTNVKDRMHTILTDPRNLADDVPKQDLRSGAFYNFLKSEVSEKMYPIKNTAISSRTFEKQGFVYIGMEIPKQVTDIIQAAKNEAKTSLRIDNPQAHHELEKCILEAWFQAVATTHNLGREAEAKPGHLNQAPVITLSDSQHRLERSVATFERDGKSAVITAAGDAAATPDFMSDSGLAGARENTLHQQEYTKLMSSGDMNNPLKQGDCIK